MLSYTLTGQKVALKTLAEIPADVVESGDVWQILRWAAIDLQPFDEAPMRKIRSLIKRWEKDSTVTMNQVRSMIALIKRHSDALEADLLGIGLRLRHCPSPEFNWRDLWVFISHIGVDSKLYAATNPESAGWNKTNMLIAEAVDYLGWLQWAKTKSASEGGNPPDRVPRPGVQPNPARKGSKVKPVPIDKLREVFNLDERNDPARDRKLHNIFH
jgi:hypothetical protein